ncbi:hypothetical protein AAHE18_18G104000 [Arachis hypogaea]
MALLLKRCLALGAWPSAAAFSILPPTRIRGSCFRRRCLVSCSCLLRTHYIFIRNGRFFLF